MGGATFEKAGKVRTVSTQSKGKREARVSIFVNGALRLRSSQSLPTADKTYISLFTHQLLVSISVLKRCVVSALRVLSAGDRNRKLHLGVRYRELWHRRPFL